MEVCLPTGLKHCHLVYLSWPEHEFTDHISGLWKIPITNSLDTCPSYFPVSDCIQNFAQEGNSKPFAHFLRSSVGDVAIGSFDG